MLRGSSNIPSAVGIAPFLCLNQASFLYLHRLPARRALIQQLERLPHSLRAWATSGPTFFLLLSLSLSFFTGSTGKQHTGNMYDTTKRRSSAGYIFALGAAAIAALPLGGAVPTPSPLADGNVSGWGEVFGLGRRNSAPDIYQRSEDGWRNKRGVNSSQHAAAKPRMARRSMERVLRARQAGACLDSTYTEDDINTLLWQGGQNTKVQLCPGAKLQLQGPIIYSARNQEISTQGYPSGSARATLQISSDESVGITAQGSMR